MSVESADVIAALRAATKTTGRQVPLLQREVKAVVAVSVDELCGKLSGPTRVRPTMFVNRSQTFNREWFRHTGLEGHESMVDVAVYQGRTDPFRTIITAESEAFGRHAVGSNESTATSGYLWDLFKLLQVPSPNRLFVARTVSRNVAQLERDIERTVRCYAPLLENDDRVFTVVLPTTARAYEDVRCSGWRIRGGRLESAGVASWS